MEVGAGYLVIIELLEKKPWPEPDAPAEALRRNNDECCSATLAGAPLTGSPRR